ncbi:DNA cytosine methyltransferase [Mucisphaera sp.]|uniref:DNA cytosine methyltransferase n=1 Tax=Mucisphaera sp. TaxID=2913024 RepID=UPI003D0E7F39
MSGRAGHRKRLVCVTASNLRSNHLYLTGHTDFFPADAFGGPSAKSELGKPIRLHVEGLDEPIETDIPTDSRTGKPRNFFRRRSWVREFFEKHTIQAGDTVSIEAISDRDFRVSTFESKDTRDCPSSFLFESEPKGNGPRVIELFAGCGGMALGFKQAGFRTVLANEWDREACDTLRENVSERVLNCAIQEIKSFPDADVVAGGPPCQGFSNLGEKVPNDPRNQLWRHYFRCVEQVLPKIFVLENVPPLLKSAEHVEMTRMAERLGYTVEGRVLNSADYGVPQTRRRAILIGSRIGKPSFPEPTHRDPNKHNLINHNLPVWRTVRDAIGHVPLEPTEKNWHIGRNPTEKSLRRYKCIPPGGNRWDLPKELTPDCWIRKTKGGTDLFGRLWWDRPSVTIRTEFYKPEKGRYLHPVANRPITHHEAALLQSFPENFKFIGRKISVGVQIGNAVPPLLAHRIALHVSCMLTEQCDNVASKSV